MNKRIKALLVLTVIAIAFSACGRIAAYSEPPKMVAYEIAAAVDSNDGGIHADEYSEWSTEKCTPFVNTSIMKSKEVTFNGKTYIGEYWYSITELFNTYQTDYYTFDGGWFSVNRLDGSLSSIVFYNINTGKQTVEDCKGEALRLAKQYIDVDQYELSTRSDEYINTFIFQRYVDGYKTCAKLSIGFSTNGDIVTFNVMMTKEIEESVKQRGINNVNSVAELFGSKHAVELLDDKVKTMYPTLLNYEVTEKVLVVLADGSIGMVHIADVNYSVSESAESIGSSRVCILLCEAD